MNINSTIQWEVTLTEDERKAMSEVVKKYKPTGDDEARGVDRLLATLSAGFLVIPEGSMRHVLFQKMGPEMVEINPELHCLTFKE